MSKTTTSVQNRAVRVLIRASINFNVEEGLEAVSLMPVVGVLAETPPAKATMRAGEWLTSTSLNVVVVHTISDLVWVGYREELLEALQNEAVNDAEVEDLAIDWFMLMLEEISPTLALARRVIGRMPADMVLTENDVMCIAYSRTQ